MSPASPKRKEISSLLIAELQHRTRNLLAVIQSIANQTIGTSQSLKEFRRASTTGWPRSRACRGCCRGAYQADHHRPLVRMELDALNAMRDGKRLVTEGPEIALPEAIVRTLALVLHELATNAAKYGALASERGSLHITWTGSVGPQGYQLELTWAEAGVSIPSETRNSLQHGFGRTLIERALPYQLRAKADYELAEDGVRCYLAIPLLTRSPANGDAV